MSVLNGTPLCNHESLRGMAWFVECAVREDAALGENLGVPQFSKRRCRAFLSQQDSLVI